MDIAAPIRCFHLAQVHAEFIAENEHPAHQILDKGGVRSGLDDWLFILGQVRSPVKPWP